MAASRKNIEKRVFLWYFARFALSLQASASYSRMKEKELYINFDEYIRQGEPDQKERAEAWRVAIGLQAVDGLKTSEYLQETARRNIEGEITIDEARELVKE